LATREEFVEKWPLYTLCDCKNFYPPESISRTCAGCGKETTWRRVGDVRDLYGIMSELGYIATYQCVLCQKDDVSIVVRIAERDAQAGYATLKVQKIGEFPPPSIEIPRDLEKRLGDSAGLYKNALICRNANFGVGALAYIRRVIEDKTNELIEVIAAQADSYGTDSKVVVAIRAAKDEKMTFDQRLQLASEAMPSTLKPDGANPLAALYGLLSDGLHAKSEEDCIRIVDEIRDVFEYVFARLRAEIEDRNKVMSKVKKWLGGRPKKEDETNAEGAAKG
jgi:hypothetical protein